jgi:hypothetical protein
VNTAYNESIDLLRFDTSAMLTGGGFDTFSPQLVYDLDLIAKASGTFNADLITVLGDVELADGSFNIDERINIFDFDSSVDATFSRTDPSGIFTFDMVWPTINTNSTDDGSGMYSSFGQSDNVLQLTVDIDQTVFTLLGLPNPFDVGFDLFDGAVYANIEILDFDIFGGMNFLQGFDMNVAGLNGILQLEDGSLTAFEFGDVIDFENAFRDLDINNDGEIDYTVFMDPNATMTNDTDLGFNIGATLDLLYAEAGIDTFLYTESISFGPVVDLGITIPLGSVDVYTETDFAFDFTEQSVNLFA